MEIPNNFYYNREEQVLLVGAAGWCPLLADSISKYKSEGKFKWLDWSPFIDKIAGTIPYHFVAANRYKPSPFSLQLTQDKESADTPELSEGGILYRPTQVVCVSLDQSALESVVDFVNVSGMQVGPLGPKFLSNLEIEQTHWKKMYDTIISSGLRPKVLMSLSLRERQKTYRKKVN